MRANRIAFSVIPDPRGEIGVLEGDALPFDVKRVFTFATGVLPTLRGAHAHRKQHQGLICTRGAVHVRAGGVFGSDASHELTPMRAMLHVVPLTWLEVWMQPHSTLLVLASGRYDEADYIRDRRELQEALA